MGIKKPNKEDDLIMQWDCRNAPPAFALFYSILQFMRMMMMNRSGSELSEANLQQLLTLLSTKNGRDVSEFFLIHGASYRKELEKILKIKDTTIRSIVDNLERLGILRKTATLSRTGGGRTSWIYALVVAGPEYTIKAQARFDQSKGLASHGKLLDDYIPENEAILRDDDLHQAQEQADAERQIILEQVKEEFMKRYGSDGKPVDLEDIQHSLRAKGMPVSDTDSTFKIAEYLEEEGVTTGIYRNGILIEGYAPTRAIIEIRNRRGS